MPKKIGNIQVEITPTSEFSKLVKELTGALSNACDAVEVLDKQVQMLQGRIEKLEKRGRIVGIGVAK